MSEPLTLDELLAAHAAGHLSLPVSLIVATHLALCPASRERYRCYEAAGGAMLERIEPDPLKPGSWRELCARLTDEGGAEPAGVREGPVPEALRRLPRPLRDHIPGSLDRLRWRRFGPAAEAELDLASPGYRTLLIRVQAGKAVPRHTHEGNELTLVLEGAFRDELGHYRRGDLAIAGPAVVHKPVADAGADCLCLTVMDARLRYTGPFGRLLNPFLNG